MIKIRTHTLSTYIVMTILFANSLLELVFGRSIRMLFEIKLNESIYIHLLIVLIAVMGLVCSLALFFKFAIALKVSLLLYIVQMIGVLYEQFYYAISIGFLVNWSLELSNLTIDINLVAVVFCIIIYTAIVKTKEN
jgi:hypothetical protein